MLPIYTRDDVTCYQYILSQPNGHSADFTRLSNPLNITITTDHFTFKISPTFYYYYYYYYFYYYYYYYYFFYYYYYYFYYY